MKKKAAWIAGVLIIVFFAYFFGSGFVKNSSAFVEDFAVSEDGRALTLRMGVASSMGYLRKVSVHQQQGGKLYLDCYGAFGGPNSSIGARDTFTVVLNEDTVLVSLYRNANCYEEVMAKDANGIWHKEKSAKIISKNTDNAMTVEIVGWDEGTEDALFVKADGERYVIRNWRDTVADEAKLQVGNLAVITYNGEISEENPAGYLICGVSNIALITEPGTGFCGVPGASVFCGTVIEINDGTMLVEPEEGTSEAERYDRILIPIEHMNASPEPQIGDVLEIVYDGRIEGAEPAKLGSVSHMHRRTLP